MGPTFEFWEKHTEYTWEKNTKNKEKLKNDNRKKKNNRLWGATVWKAEQLTNQLTLWERG